MTHFGTRAWSWKLVLLHCILTAVAASTISSSRRQTPAKRTYDSHAYYVVELDPELLPPTQSIHSVAQALGAQHVEQVGELEHHYLIKAPHDLVNQGEPSWSPPPPSKRSVPLDSAATHTTRDLVLERHDLLKRRRTGPASHLRARDVYTATGRLSTRSAIRSLEKQHPRLRIKRDLPVLPPDSNPALLQGRSPQRVEAGTSPNYGIVQAVRDHFSIADPLWTKQWHLVNGAIKENSINVSGVWDQGIFGKGVNVAIVDDGLDMHSDDLAENFVSAENSWRR